MSAKRSDVPHRSTEASIHLPERALIAYARRAPIPWGKYRLVNALWRWVGGKNHTREAQLIYSDYRVPCDISEMIQRQLYFFGTYYLERNFLAVWRDLARQSQVVFDVGANAGVYSLAALSANPDCSVHAFEPTPEIADRLRQTKQRNDLTGLTIAELAVCEATGEAQLVHCDGGGGNGGMNFIDPAAARDGGRAVSTTCLDDYCRDEGIARIDLIKVDVQGLEPDVFRGASELLRDGRIGTIFVELNWGALGEESSADQLIELLDLHGFAFSEITRAPRWRRRGVWMRSHSDVMARQRTE